MNRNFIWLSVTALIMVGLVVFGYTHGSELIVLNPQGPIGLEERWVIGITVLLSAIVVVPVFIMLFLFAWKYRAGNPKAHIVHEPNWDHDSWFAEFVWWIVPGVIVLFLSIIAWNTTHQLDPFKPLQGSVAPITVDVIALDWKWLFIYPDQGIASVNMVEFPANTPVHFYITSDAPMNSFWIPSLGGQIMAMPGMTTQLNLLASTQGNYDGRSSNISGDGFAGMTFTAKAVSQTDFNTWVTSVKGMQTPLNATTYTMLAQPSEYNTPTFYSSVDSGLYTASVMKYMMRTVASTPSVGNASAQSVATSSKQMNMEMPGMNMDASSQ